MAITHTTILEVAEVDLMGDGLVTDVLLAGLRQELKCVKKL